MLDYLKRHVCINVRYILFVLGTLAFLISVQPGYFRTCFFIIVRVVVPVVNHIVHEQHPLAHAHNTQCVQIVFPGNS